MSVGRPALGPAPGSRGSRDWPPWPPLPLRPGASSNGDAIAREPALLGCCSRLPEEGSERPAMGPATATKPPLGRLDWALLTGATDGGAGTRAAGVAGCCLAALRGGPAAGALPSRMPAISSQAPRACSGMKFLWCAMASSTV